jgi:hypothetical protein
MKNTNQADALKDAIALLESKQAGELQLLRQQFHITYDSLKPMNLIKKGLQDITALPDLKNGLINNAIGLATGYLSKKVLIGATRNPIKRILGTVLEFAVAGLVTKQVEQVKTTEEEQNITKNKN